MERRVLVVEDEPAITELLLTLLELNGFEAAAAPTVAAGLALLAWQPQFAILDLMLPDGIGTAILDRIRAENLPIKVAISTAVGNEIVDAAERSKPDIIFRKPYNLWELMGWLNATTQGQ